MPETRPFDIVQRGYEPPPANEDAETLQKLRHLLSNQYLSSRETKALLFENRALAKNEVRDQC